MALALAVVLAGGCSGPEPVAEAVDVAAPAPTVTGVVPDRLPRLVAAAGDPARVEELLGTEADPPNPAELADPLGPMDAFLAAEALGSVGRPDEARARYREVARWSAGEGQRPGGIGTSLGLPSLWRWVDLLSLDPADKEEVREAVELTRPILSSPFSESLISFGVLPSLPQLEEETLGRVALLAWHHVGREVGQGFLVDYLAKSRETTLSPAHQEMYDEVVQQGWVSRDRVDLLRAERLAALGAFDTAFELLERLAESRDSHNRAGATLALVRLQGRTLRGNAATQRELLTRVVEQAKDPFHRQEALYRRALLQDSEERLETDLQRLLEEHPEGPWADDALFRLAEGYERRWALDADDSEAWETARSYYERLRAYPGDNDWLDSAYFRPALVHYTLGDARNLSRAVELLSGYLERAPDGAFRVLAQFWRGRSFEALDQRERARRDFEQLAAEHGYSYYGLRSRMHLESGAEAALRLWPGAALQAEIRQAYRGERPPGIELLSVYHRRLGAAIETALYPALMEALAGLGEAFPGERLSTLDLEALEERGLLTRMVLLLSLRQDVLAAAHSEESADNHLRVQSTAGYGAGDWPLAVSMAISTTTEYAGSRPLRQLEGFLKAAYPPVYRDVIAAAAESWTVPPELVYAVIRRESLFSPAAHSRAGALGLFQFMPDTFDNLDRGEAWRWNLLDDAGVESRTEYLLDGPRSVDLGARYLGHALLVEWLCRLRFDRGCIGVRADSRPTLPPPDLWFEPDAPLPERLIPLLAVLEHSKGYGSVNRWRRRWQAADREGDFEYMLETVGSIEARILSRGVLSDAAVVRAAGIFSEE